MSGEEDDYELVHRPLGDSWVDLHDRSGPNDFASCHPPKPIEEAIASPKPSHGATAGSQRRNYTTSSSPFPSSDDAAAATTTSWRQPNDSTTTSPQPHPSHDATSCDSATASAAATRSQPGFSDDDDTASGSSHATVTNSQSDFPDDNDTADFPDDNDAADFPDDNDTADFPDDKDTADFSDDNDTASPQDASTATSGASPASSSQVDPSVVKIHPRRTLIAFNTTQTLEWLAKAIPGWSEDDGKIVKEQHVLASHVISGEDRLATFGFREETLTHLMTLREMYLDYLKDFWNRPVFLRIVVPKRYCGPLIGKGGVELQNFQSRHGVYAYFDQNYTARRRQLLMSGTQHCIGLALQSLVDSMFPTETEAQKTVDLRVLVQNDAVTEIIGPQGANHRRITAATDCKLIIEKNYTGEGHDRLTTLVGTPPSLVKGLREVVACIERKCAPRANATWHNFNASVPVPLSYIPTLFNRCLPLVQTLGADTRLLKDHARPRECNRVEIFGPEAAVRASYGIMTSFVQQQCMKKPLDV